MLFFYNYKDYCNVMYLMQQGNVINLKREDEGDIEAADTTQKFKKSFGPNTRSPYYSDELVLACNCNCCPVSFCIILFL